MVYDVTDNKSYENLDNWKKVFSEALEHSPENLPFAIIGNKFDKGSVVSSTKVQQEWIDEEKANMHI